MKLFNQEFEKYRDLSFEKIREDVFKDHDKSKLFSLREIFDENSDTNKRYERLEDILVYLLPDEEEELKKLGFKLTGMEGRPWDPTKTYEDKDGNVIELSGELGCDVAKFNGTEAPRFDDCADVVGAKEKCALEWIKQKIKEDKR